MNMIKDFIKKTKKEFVLQKYIRLINKFRKGYELNSFKHESDPKLAFLKGNFYCQLGKSRIASRYYQFTIDIYKHADTNSTKYHDRLSLMCYYIFSNYPEMKNYIKFPNRILIQLNRINIIVPFNEFACIY